MRLFRAAVLLIVGVLAGRCVSSTTSGTPFQKHLAREIEAMLLQKQHRAASGPAASARSERGRGLAPASGGGSLLLDTVHFESASAAEDAATDHRRDGRADLQLIMPVAAAVRLTDNFDTPRDHGRRRHQGIDLFAPRGTHVVAAAAGIVSRISDHPRGGNCLWITTSETTTFYYAHLERFADPIESGMYVEAGQLLGYVGTTGNAAGGAPHLHFEVQLDGRAVNPYPLLLSATPFDRQPSLLRRDQQAR